MSAASVAVMYVDRRKCARVFVKFFRFFCFPHGQTQAVQAVSVENVDTQNAGWRFGSFECPFLWLHFLLESI
jgi:hypothetical protein